MKITYLIEFDLKISRCKITIILEFNSIFDDSLGFQFSQNRHYSVRLSFHEAVIRLFNFKFVGSADLVDIQRMSRRVVK